MLSPLRLLTCIAPCLLVGASASHIVRLGKTQLVGLDLPLLNQTFFGGIPYAKPPLGPLRLQPPVLQTSLKPGSFDATEFGPACLQTDMPLADMSEDCLTINVFRPSGIPDDVKLPVLVWTYGGSLTMGAASLYNGSAIVAQSIARGTPLIYVNYNYRLGPLGFPQGHEAAANGAFNLGLKDEITAFKWVQTNIGAFGGDKNKVTIFGESAGAISNSVLFLGNTMNGLARAAIFESGSQGTESILPDNRETDWQNFVAGVSSCASLARSGATFDCIKAANTSEIFAGLSAAMAETTELFPWAINLDGPHGLVPDLPSVMFKRGEFAKLPFIAGTNLDEATIFISPSINSSQQTKDFLLSLTAPGILTPALNASIDNLLRLYPDIPALGSPFDTGNDTFGLNSQYKRATSVCGDLTFLSQRRLWIEAATNAGVKTFAYLFRQPQPNSPPQLGVFHGSEIPFVYGAPNDTSPSALMLSRTMIDYWVSFATSLDPNDGLGTPRPEWKQFTPDNKVIIQLLGDNITMIPDDFHLEQTALINSDPLVWDH
ncbi:esterase 1 [Mycena haematopus]|nr:esterase 1 [Mycena haematopus]